MWWDEKQASGSASGLSDGAGILEFQPSIDPNSGVRIQIADQASAWRRGSAQPRPFRRNLSVDRGAGMRVAIVHEWLDTYSGSERVLEQLLQCFPHADLFAVVDFMNESE